VDINDEKAMTPGAKRRPTGKKPDLPGTSRAGRARTDDQRISERRLST
jgi:hypothetical protein